MTKNVDYIIVGQGIAGSLLAYNLKKSGKSIHLIDDDHRGASSAVAAGIINPITGRRFAKSWRIDEMLPFARDFYQQMESDFSIQVFHNRSVLRFLHGTKDINDWYGRSAWEGFSQYMHEYKKMETLAELFHLPFDMGEISPAGQLDMPLLIQTFKDYFIKKEIISFQKLDYKSIIFEEEQVKLGGITAEKIIFCEGHQARFNPWFEVIPFEPAKGEVLFVKIPNLNFEYLLKNKLMMAPLGNDMYWTGSNYEWNSPNDLPTETFKLDFVKKLENTLKLPFEIVAHKAAIRPTIKDRRPVMGTHPTNAKIAIFNGLGTKGASIAPFWAKEMTAHLLSNKPLDEEVDIQRFYTT